MANTLAGEYDVIMPDARGHGKSSKPSDGYHYEDHANDVAGLIKTLGLTSPVVIGHSMGGMTAALTACHMPKIFRGVILADPPFLSPEVQRSVYESDVAEQHQQFLNKSADEILTEARNKHPHRPLELLNLLMRARRQTSLSALQILTPPYPDYKQLVSAIDVPTLLVICETGVVSSPVAAELRSLNPKLRIEKIAGVGHGLHYDKPEQFVTVVKSFLHSI